MPRKNSLCQSLIPLLPVRALVTVSTFLVVFPDSFPAAVNSVVSSRSQPLPDFLVIYSSHPILRLGLDSDGTGFDIQLFTGETARMEHVNLMPMYQLNSPLWKRSIRTLYKPFHSRFVCMVYWCLSIFSLIELCFFWRLECIHTLSWQYAGHSGHAVYGVGLRPLAC